MAGCVISTKYSGLYVLPALILSLGVYNFCNSKDKLQSFYITFGEIALIILTIIFIFFILTHKTILDGDVQFALLDAHGRYKGGHLGATTNASLAFYSSVIFLLPVGVLGGVLMLIGLYDFFYTGKYSFLVFLIAFLMVFLIIHANYNTGFVRNGALIIPVIFLLIGAALTKFNKCNQFFKDRSYGLYLKTLLYLGLALVFLEPALRSFIQLENDYRQDSRSAADKWIKKNIGIEHNIGFIHAAWGGPYVGVPSFISPLKTSEIPLGSNVEELDDVTHYIYDSWQVDVHSEGTSMLSSRPFSELHFNNPARDSRPKLVDEHEKFLSDFKLIKTFPNTEYRGPTIYIYKRFRFKKNIGMLSLGTWGFENLGTWRLTDNQKGLELNYEKQLHFIKKNKTYKLEIGKTSGSFAFQRKFLISEMEGRTFSFSFDAKIDIGELAVSSESYLLPSGLIDDGSVPAYTFDGDYLLTTDWQTFKTKIIFPSFKNYTKTGNDHAIVRIFSADRFHDGSIFIKNLKYREY